MCTSSGPTIAPAPPPPPAPPPAAPDKAPQQQAVGARRRPGVNTPGMAAGSLLTGPSGIASNALNTGASSLLGG